MTFMPEKEDESGKSRIICLDVGRKRIGIAVSDPTGKVALPLQVLNRTSREKDLDAVADLISRYQAKRLVVGYPRRLNGTASSQSIIVEEFVKMLRELPVVTELWDERLTTRLAERDLIRIGVRRKPRRHVIDAAAAALILQNYLDSKRENPK